MSAAFRLSGSFSQQWDKDNCIQQGNSRDRSNQDEAESGQPIQVAGKAEANFAAYLFAPPILVTPLGALSVLVGCVRLPKDKIMPF